MVDRPEVGDRVSILVYGDYQRFGVVVETDYHPLGIDDAVKIRFEGEIEHKTEWWSSRWVMRESKPALKEAP